MRRAVRARFIVRAQRASGGIRRPLKRDVRRLMKLPLAVSLLSGVLSLAACGSTFEVPETVVVHLSRGDAPVAGMPLRYYSQPECTGPFVAAVTDSTGNADFSRIAHRGRYAVVLEKPSLCLEPDRHGVVAQLWTTTHDPPDKLRLNCDLYGPSPEVCTRVD